MAYRLVPGSSISVDGTTEPLTGGFVWEREDIGSTTAIGFNATHLEFTSDSYTISLLTGPENDVVSNLFSDGRTYFMEYVTIPELRLTPIELTVADGSAASYSGSRDSPTGVDYSLKGVPVGGGNFLFDMRLTAEAVPEPSTLAFFALGAGVLAAARRGRPRRPIRPAERGGVIS